MAVELGATYTFTAPAAADGFGEVAILNGDPTASNFCGYVTEISGLDSPEVREVADLIPEGDGGTHSSFYYGRRPFTFEFLFDPALGSSLNARIEKFQRATNAMRADGSIVWTETGGSPRTISFRRQQPLRITERRPKRCLFAGVSADPRIYAVTPTTGTSPTTNAGNVGTPPTFTFTPSGNGTVILTNTTAGLGNPALTITVGTGGVATGSAVTVDFGARTVTQGTRKDYAVTFPGSTWWEVVPGANTWTRTGTATISVAAAISIRSAWL